MLFDKYNNNIILKPILCYFYMFLLAVLLNLFLVAEPFSKVQLYRGTPNLIFHKMFNIIFPAKNKRISVKNEFFSKTFLIKIFYLFLLCKHLEFVFLALTLFALVIIPVFSWLFRGTPFQHCTTAYSFQSSFEFTY